MKVKSTTYKSALVLMLLSACKCGMEPTEDEPVPEMPANMRGVWLDHWSTSMGYQLATEMYDFDKKVWFKGNRDPWDMAPYRGFGISLEQNGHFTWVLGSDGGVGGCQSYSIDFMKGTAVVQEGNTIRFRTTARRQRYESTCDPSLNYDRDASGGDFVMDYAQGATQDTGRPTLRLVNKADGTAFDYFKK